MKVEYADVIIRNNRGQILLLHRSYGDGFMAGKWCLPGGHIDKGEDPLEAAQREVLEETGLSIVGHLLTVKEREDCVIHYYEACSMSPLETPELLLDNEEHRGYEWVEIKDVVNRDLIADLATYIESELLSKLSPMSIVPSQYATRTLTPEESPAVPLDYHWGIIENAFNQGHIDEEQFFKAKALYIKAKKKASLDILEKAFNQDLITEDQYIDALVKAGDPSHGGKLVKKLITEKSGKITTKWVDPHTGEAPVKVKKEKVAPTEQWYDRFKGFQLNCYPIGIDRADVQINEEGDIDSHWILKWKDPKSGTTKNAYSKGFMDRNAAEKWNRMKDVKAGTIEMIKEKSTAFFELEDYSDKVREASAIIHIIAQTGLRRGNKDKFKITGNRGVSSLSPDNVKIEGSVVKFNFVGKSYQDNTAQIDHPGLAKYLGELQELRKGQEFLFDATDATIDSVFDKVGGVGLKIKDMRTYVAGDIARKVLFDDPLAPPPIPKDADKKEIQKLVEHKLQVCYEKVSEKLNNTPVMAKNSYIHPNIIDFWLKKLNLNSDEIKKGSILGQFGDKVIELVKSVLDKKESDTASYSMDEILAAYPKEIIQETDCMNEEDEEMCDTFNEPVWLSEDTLEKSE